ncbi:hypothetical protein G7Y89_g2529 [Cudoniella acicularis]|uniref:Uncharacterized protein n=1 Tax=Cudoniella acicularis TaxID=354080 RepID=A0A8H4RUC2_9HELO|nr:hypothetical protein G7Y89_g2529 [Cudoniella acicularis]
MRLKTIESRGIPHSDPHSLPARHTQAEFTTHIIESVTYSAIKGTNCLAASYRSLNLDFASEYQQMLAQVASFFSNEGFRLATGEIPRLGNSIAKSKAGVNDPKMNVAEK